MSKRLFIIIGIFLIVGIGVFVFTQRAREERLAPLSGQPPIAPIVRPSFPASVPRPQPGYQVAAPERVFPPSLATVTYSPPQSVRPQALLVAQALGLAGEPTEIPGTRGTLFTWQQDGKTLTVGGQPTEVSYTAYQSSRTAVGAQSIDVDAIAEQLIKQIGLITPGVSLQKTKIALYEPTSDGPKETANTSLATTLRADYSYTIDEYPIYTRYPNPALSIQINGDRQTEALNAYWYTGVQKTESVVPIVSYEEAVRRLLAGEGALLAVNVQDPPLTDIPQKFTVQTSTISKAELAYYYTPGNTILAPVFVFYGQGIDSETNKPADTLTVVSALPTGP